MDTTIDIHAHLGDICFPGGGQLIGTMGTEKVLFGSDWPWGKRKPALKILKLACKGDHQKERRILFENAAQLMNLQL
jgi:predicted TIM-barrel fold metal-dependent hydrolase